MFEHKQSENKLEPCLALSMVLSDGCYYKSLNRHLLPSMYLKYIHLVTCLSHV